MRRYETILIMRPSAVEDTLNVVLDKAAGVIQSFGGSIIRTDKWGLRKLAYIINKEQQGHYYLIDFAAQPETIKELERILRIEDLVLKFLTVKLEDSCDPEAARQALEASASENAAKESRDETEEDD